MQSNVAIVNSTVSHTLILLRGQALITTRKEKKMMIMCGDGYVNQLDCGDYFTATYRYIKTVSCTP